MLVRFSTSQQRDVVQSYAANLASSQGKAGLRIDVPDKLRGLFRLFESHFGQIKRAVRFDDIEQSMYMDVKLEDTNWHRITAADIREVKARKKKSAPSTAALAAGNSSAEAERKKILLFPGTQSTICIPVVDSEDEEKESQKED